MLLITILLYIKNRINIYNYKSYSSEDNTYKSLKIAYKFCKKNLHWYDYTTFEKRFDKT